GQASNRLLASEVEEFALTARWQLPMTVPIDFQGINQAALGGARLLLPILIPGGRFLGQEYVVRNPLRDDQHPGSFKINVRSGVWKDFATNDGGGDLVSLAAYIWECGPGDAARRLADALGIAAPTLNGTSASRQNGRQSGAAHQV